MKFFLNQFTCFKINAFRYSGNGERSFFMTQEAYCFKHPTFKVNYLYLSNSFFTFRRNVFYFVISI